MFHYANDSKDKYLVGTATVDQQWNEAKPLSVSLRGMNFYPLDHVRQTEP